MFSKPFLLTSLSLFVPMTALLTGCAPGFSGTWDCHVDSTTTYSAPTDAPDYDGTGDVTLSVTEDPTELVMTRTNGGVAWPCPLHFKVGADGGSATLAPNQTCLNSVGNTFTYTSGSADLADTNTLTGKYAFTVTGKTANGDDLVGAGPGQFTCTREDDSAAEQ